MRIWPWSVIAELRSEVEYDRQYIDRLERTVDAQREEIIKLQRADSQFQIDYHAARNQIEYLVRTIRDMDEQIYKMSQCSDWAQMRPNFQSLNEGMLVRKRAESDRINELLRPELIKTYNDQKRLGGLQ
jgi:septal ring factor EnvC (AmiA/AmiB activator)